MLLTGKKLGGCLMSSEAQIIEIPIKVGQVVYMDKYPWQDEKEIEPFQITSISITCNKKGIWTKKFRANWVLDGRVRDWSHDPAFDDIGKTVFFTKEEAESVLLNGKN
jgi:hypothetical protein